MVPTEARGIGSLGAGISEVVLTNPGSLQEGRALPLLAEAPPALSQMVQEAKDEPSR